jgi:hypothetical protein
MTGSMSMTRMEEMMGIEPEWQKARILQYPARPYMVGRTVWTRGKPEFGMSRGHTTGQVLSSRWRIAVAIVPCRSLCAVLRSDWLELLYEFTDNPTWLTWDEFLRNDDDV